MSAAVICVYISSKVLSSAAVPSNACVASSAPVLTPPTASNSGRRPLSRQPSRKPAPKAPFWPPPDSDSRFRGRPFLSSNWRMKLSSVLAISVFANGESWSGCTGSLPFGSVA